MVLAHWKGGGFPGPDTSLRLGPLEVGELPKPTAGVISELLHSCRFYDLATILPPGTHTQTDPTPIRIGVEEPGWLHQVQWDDNADTPEELRRTQGILADVEGWVRCDRNEWHETAKHQRVGGAGREH